MSKYLYGTLRDTENEDPERKRFFFLNPKLKKPLIMVYYVKNFLKMSIAVSLRH